MSAKDSLQLRCENAKLFFAEPLPNTHYEGKHYVAQCNIKGAAIRRLSAVSARNKGLCCKKDTNFTCSVYLSTHMHTEVCLFSVEPLRKDFLRNYQEKPSSQSCLTICIQQAIWCPKSFLVISLHLACLLLNPTVVELSILWYRNLFLKWRSRAICNRVTIF